ncbi:hypothetical protein [Actinoplanes derwentensis]|uniref:hypothetical protein n=1 Tax=Actinoplanes derwentensis TaxID=113562 RepID=UPI0012FD5140|nr:hypothetical protein [Actinoplanes derwentensis]
MAQILPELVVVRVLPESGAVPGARLELAVAQVRPGSGEVWARMEPAVALMRAASGV